MIQHSLQTDSSVPPRLNYETGIRKFNDFLESRRFLLMAGILTAAANMLGTTLVIFSELFAYTIFILISCFIALWGRDLKPMLIIIICCYLTPSIYANPGRFSASVFYPKTGGIYLMLLFACFLGCLIFRIVKDPQLGGRRFLKKSRSLIPGMLILGVGYILGGAFSGRYFDRGIMNFVFAMMQFLSVIAVYWLLAGMIHWDRVDPDYLAWVGLTVGLTVCFEVISTFILNHVIQNGVIRAVLIFTGWGNANNIGCIIAMMIPYAVYLGRSTGKAWLFSIISMLMMAFVCLTCSRASIIVAFLIYPISVAVVMRGFPKGDAKKAYVLFNSGIALLVLILVIIFHQRIIIMFQELLNRGINPRDRQYIYPEGIRTFLRNPVFGEGFYPSSDVIYEWSTQEKMKALLPGRWHNTVIQLLASCGITGLLCYGYHRFQTIRLFWKKSDGSHIFTALVLISLLLMSLLDCHFFNVGPTLFYSGALAFAEFSRDNKLCIKESK